MTVEKKIKSLREKVATLDDKLVQITAARLRLTKEIGLLKRRNDLQVIDPGVEKAIRARVKKRARQDGVSSELALSLLEQMIFHSRAQQAALPRKPRPENCLVVGGKGQMGGWFCKYLRTLGFNIKVLDRRGGAEPSLKRVAGKADLIFLATPLTVTATLLDELAALKSSALILEMNSIKEPILSQLANAKKHGLRVASIHPMFGPGASLAHELRVVVCEAPSLVRIAEIKKVFRETNFQLTAVPLAEHDRLMSLVLAVPHLMNMAFVDFLTKQVDKGLNGLAAVAGTTFQKQLAIAKKVVADHPELYYAIQSTNPHTAAAVQAFTASLDQLSGFIKKGEKKKFLEALSRLR